MEYFVGSVMTLVSVYLMNRLVSKNKTISKKIKPLKFSQSYVSEMTKDFVPMEELMPSFNSRKKTQSTDHFDRNSTRVLYMDGFAWFIKKIDGLDTLHFGVITENGIDEDSVKRVDTMGMDDVELKKTIFIVEKLTEGL